MTNYTAFKQDDFSVYDDGLSLKEALSARWDIDGSKRGWSVMSDTDFKIYKNLSEDQHVECVIDNNGVTRITRMCG